MTAVLVLEAGMHHVKLFLEQMRDMSYDRALDLAGVEDAARPKHRIAP